MKSKSNSLCMKYRGLYFVNFFDKFIDAFEFFFPKFVWNSIFSAVIAHLKICVGYLLSKRNFFEFTISDSFSDFLLGCCLTLAEICVECFQLNFRRSKQLKKIIFTFASSYLMKSNSNALNLLFSASNRLKHPFRNWTQLFGNFLKSIFFFYFSMKEHCLNLNYQFLFQLIILHQQFCCFRLFSFEIVPNHVGNIV